MSLGKVLLTLLCAVLLAGGGALLWLLNTVRWQDAYQVLGVVEQGPQGIAQAMADGDPPQGLELGARVHAPGTLMRIRYEQLDDTGTPVATHEIRALVPELPFVGSDAPGTELDELTCRERCRRELAAANAVEILRGGRGGLSDEWLLRLPLGKTFDLGKSDLKIQDIAEEQWRTYPVKPLRITALAACKATVKVGTAMHIEYFKFPVPRALRTTKWLQVEGCAEMMNAGPLHEEVGAPAPAPLPAPEPALRKSWLDRADWEAVRPQQEGGLRWAVLMADEDWLARHGKPRLFHLLRSCQFNAQTREWVSLPQPEGDAEITLQTSLPRVQRIAYHFPKKNALFFAEWTETEDGVNGPVHRILIPSGADSCREATPGTFAEGEVLACVPSGGIADQVLVPDPVMHCEASR